MRRLMLAATLAASVVGLSACAEHANRVPGTNVIRLYDTDGDVDMSHIKAVCLSTGVAKITYHEEEQNKVAYVVCKP